MRYRSKQEKKNFAELLKIFEDSYGPQIVNVDACEVYMTYHSYLLCLKATSTGYKVWCNGCFGNRSKKLIEEQGQWRWEKSIHFCETIEELRVYLKKLGYADVGETYLTWWALKGLTKEEAEQKMKESKENDS